MNWVCEEAMLVSGEAAEHTRCGGQFKWKPVCRVLNIGQHPYISNTQTHTNGIWNISQSTHYFRSGLWLVQATTHMEWFNEFEAPPKKTEADFLQIQQLIRIFICVAFTLWSYVMTSSLTSNNIYHSLIHF